MIKLKLQTLFILLLLFVIVSCGGGKLSKEEAANITLKYKGQLFVPPPGSSSDVINKVNSAGEGLVQEAILTLQKEK